MSRVNEFGTCPLCRKSDRLELTDKQLYYHVKNKYGSAMVEIRCWNCDLAMYAHPHIAGTNNYEILVGELKKKWAKLKH